jgi:hypothetical protein
MVGILVIAIGARYLWAGLNRQMTAGPVAPASWESPRLACVAA